MTEDVNATSPEGLPAGGQYVSLATVRGALGAVCIWTWLLSVLFMGKTFASLGHFELPVGSIQTAALGGLTCALVAIACMVRKGGRGPEPSRGWAVGLGCVPAVLMPIVVLAAPSGAVAGPTALVVWALSGATAAYALRRSLALVEAFACGFPAKVALRLFASCSGAAALIGMLVSRMDPLGATVATCAAVPLALWLLPQGRLSLTPRTEETRDDVRRTRTKVPASLVEVMACLVVVGVAFGFQTSVGDVLYSTSPDSPTLVYIVLLVTAVLLGCGVSALQTRFWRPLAQGLCAFCVLAVAPMLFLPYDAGSLAWRLCQNGLLLGTGCLCSLLGFVSARGGFGAARPTDGMPGLVAAVLFLATLMGGRLLGAALAQGSGVGSAPFEVAVLVLAALLLACGFVLGLAKGPVQEQGNAQADEGGAAEGAAAAVQDGWLTSAEPAKGVGLEPHGGSAGYVETDAPVGAGVRAGRVATAAVRGEHVTGVTAAGCPRPDASTGVSADAPAGAGVRAGQASVADAEMAAKDGRAVRACKGVSAATAEGEFDCGGVRPSSSAQAPGASGRPTDSSWAHRAAAGMPLVVEDVRPGAGEQPAGIPAAPAANDLSSPGPAGLASAQVPSSQPADRATGKLTLTQRCDRIVWRYGLSEREHDVLLLLARGLNAQQVAERMVVSRNTVKSHMAHIYNKLSIHTRAELDALLRAADEKNGDAAG